MLRPAENTSLVVQEKPIRSTWSLADLRTQPDAISPSVQIYPYVGKHWEANILPLFAPAEQAVAADRCGRIAHYYPDVKPLLSDQEAVFRTDRPRFWRDVWRGSSKNEPYCNMAEERWRVILECPNCHSSQFSFANFPNIPLYLPQPNGQIPERIFIGNFNYWLKFEDEVNGLTIIDGLPFITTALLRHHDTGEIFALLVRPFDANAMLCSPQECVETIRHLPPSLIKTQVFSTPAVTTKPITGEKI